MTTSALLREAAAAIRAKAEAFPASDWPLVTDAPDWDGDEAEIAEGIYIASWPPETALAVADLLLHEADRADHQPWTDSAIDAALVLAGRVLGREADLTGADQ